MIVVVTLLTTLGATERDPTPDGTYDFRSYEPGSEYEVVIEQFQRFGPLRADLESDETNPLGPETRVETIRIVLDESGKIRSWSEVRSAAGELWFTSSTVDGLETRRADLTGETQTRPVPDGEAIRGTQTLDYGRVFEGLGWRRVGPANFRGRQTTVYELLTTADEPALEGAQPFPYLDDLVGVTSFRSEAPWTMRQGSC